MYAKENAGGVVDNDSQALFEQRDADDLIVGFVYGRCVKAPEIAMAQGQSSRLFPHHRQTVQNLREPGKGISALASASGKKEAVQRGS